MKTPLMVPLTLALALGSTIFSAAAADTRPNFLFIYTDDQRYDALSVVQREQGARGRFPWFKTPNLDRLAAEGARFRNAFVVNSLCSPSRACFLTSRYNHLNGIANNRTPFPTNSVTHASVLRAAGYRTGYIGKWHMDSQRGPRPGFDFSASFIGHARYFDAPFEVDGVRTNTSGWIDDVSTDYALRFLKENRAQPFLLVVGYKSPHGPFEPPDRTATLFEDDEARPAPNATAYPPYLQRPPSERTNVNQFGDATNPGPRRLNRNYFRTLAAIDGNVGRLLQTLDELRLTENTMVVYASDNGFYLGEHGLGDKRSAYEESIRIPLLVRFPNRVRPGSLIDALALNIDLAPTLLDFAGVAIPPEMQGRSWRPLFADQPAGWRQSFFYEYFLEADMGPPTVLAVRTETAKLIKYPGHDDWLELYDLKSDPFETNNLARRSTHRELLAALSAEFDRQAAAVQFRIPEYADKPEDATRFARTRQGGGDRLNTFVLRYDFATLAGDRVPDLSGKGNDGKAGGVTLVAGRRGRQAARFDGRAKIEVANAPTLNCSGGPWTFEAIVRPEGTNGIVLARGGASHGYALYFENGRPAVGVTVDNERLSIGATNQVVGQWVHLAGVLTQDRRLELYLNGARAAEKRLPSFIARDPRDTMQIGADTGSPVTATAEGRGFTGLMESVSLFSGERPADELRKAAAALGN